MIGTLLKILAGSKNQKTPTLAVNKAGRIKVKRVMFFPKPSLKDQAKRRTEKRLNPPIAQKRKLLSKNWIPIKPKERRKEVIKKRRRFDIVFSFGFDSLSHQGYRGWHKPFVHHPGHLMYPKS